VKAVIPAEDLAHVKAVLQTSFDEGAQATALLTYIRNAPLEELAASQSAALRLGWNLQPQLLRSSRAGNEMLPFAAAMPGGYAPCWDALALMLTLPGHSSRAPGAEGERGPVGGHMHGDSAAPRLQHYHGANRLPEPILLQVSFTGCSTTGTSSPCGRRTWTTSFSTPRSTPSLGPSRATCSRRCTAPPRPPQCM
jgi:hypothetical protein